MTKMNEDMLTSEEMMNMFLQIYSLARDEQTKTRLKATLSKSDLRKLREYIAEVRPEFQFH